MKPFLALVIPYFMANSGYANGQTQRQQNRVLLQLTMLSGREDGVDICATIHDAILIEAMLGRIREEDRYDADVYE